MAGILGRLAQIAATLLVCATAGIAPAGAATEIAWWHAMSGELGRQLEKLAADFNASQSDYRVVPTYKGNYTQTVTAAIFAFRSSSQPTIVQVNEIATATMMAAKGAVYPVYELMRDESEVFSPADYLPAVTGYYTDLDGNMLSFPFNASTPILYYNKALFRRAGLDPEAPPATWPDVGTMAKRLIDAGATCGFTTSWPSWVHIENFAAYHDLPLATRSNGLGGLDAELVFNNPAVVRHIAQLADWQKTKIFDYSGRATAAEPRFQQGDCGIFIGSSATRADILANAKFDVGYGRLPYWPDIAGAPQNTIIGGATLWVLRGRTAGEYKGAAKFFAYLSKPEVQAAWHQHTGYLPITKAAYDLTRAQGFYDRNPGTAISIEQITLKPPTENSRGLRLGSFVLVRAAIEDEIEHAVRGEKSAKDAMDAAVDRGNKLLRQFERTKP
ncbi:sn-glycerol-3-phosphate ABC transporter substrate-binding protein UgpB [Rhodopseudomonas sp. BR0C11]|uniref:sn-glycerol-3-phosphate ABC transporter substrate-binding protein UgpB n=1 Tax=Rhodopseudomonas sp. BR0C11 TaxID=2269370 RepID=UPI0013DFD414|nr:sn-glycerol-3-phosphate ABC transporter substrate-binding protein UgpB [Rhodopseudomonas sp. BR0C11]NEV78566.1 sn-glycerol-3-phosphate ABC transporter substrate-binding protein UgpB [Rhodopseudomonas sp. BR0C11]